MTAQVPSNFNHKPARPQLPPPPASVHVGAGNEGTAPNVDILLDQWINDHVSNLAVLTGEFGAGKTLTLRRLLATLLVAGKRAASIRYDATKSADLLDTSQQGVSDLVVIDDFDVVNVMGGHQLTAPDLRDLETVFHKSQKVLIATRRTASAAANGDELMRQLAKIVRYEKFNVREPLLIELQPYDIETLAESARAADDHSLMRVCHYLRTEGRIAEQYLRRPLLVEMMVTISDSLRDQVLSIADLYNEYVET